MVKKHSYILLISIILLLVRCNSNAGKSQSVSGKLINPIDRSPIDRLVGWLVVGWLVVRTKIYSGSQ